MMNDSYAEEFKRMRRLRWWFLFAMLIGPVGAIINHVFIDPQRPGDTGTCRVLCCLDFIHSIDFVAIPIHAMPPLWATLERRLALVVASGILEHFSHPGPLWELR